MIATIYLEKDLTTFYVPAASFPEGILDAFDRLKAALPPEGTRLFWGFSRPERGLIQYRAAVQEAFPGEAGQLGLTPFVITKGSYLSSTIAGWMEHPEKIGACFQEMLQHPGLDPDGWCLEQYIDDGIVRLLVKLK